MREILEYPIEELLPQSDTILSGQGIPEDATPEDKVIELAKGALELFEELCEPVGVLADISKKEFDEIYSGEGLNKNNDPVSFIYPKADFLALFAITVGETVSEKISDLFETHDYALAAMLDTAASEITELAGVFTEQYFMHHLIKENGLFKELSVLRYSPGYCGWHISGQKKLFEYLEPEEIGISLNDSYLMEPLKSISGVMIVGRPEIHQFDIGFSFCDNCQDQICQDRISSILNKKS